MSTTRIALAAVAAAAVIGGSAGSAAACAPAVDAWLHRQAAQVTPERAAQAHAHAVQARSWQDELVRHRFH